jgi:hypothetical protein
MNAIVSSLFDQVFQRSSASGASLFCVFCQGKSATIGQTDLLASYVWVLGAWCLVLGALCLVCRSSHISDYVLR